MAFDNDLEALAGVRELVNYMPSSNEDKPPRVAPTDDASESGVETGTEVGTGRGEREIGIGWMQACSQWFGVRPPYL